MSPYLSVRKLARVVFPRSVQNGALCMLKAYFDDSGSHDQSPVVLMGGLVGTEDQWDFLEGEWQKHLDRPICGKKERLERFHMAECQDSRGEFTGWKRIETDYFSSQLQKLILDSGVSGYACGVPRQEWDKLVRGDFRDALGDAEGFCWRNVFVAVLDWARENSKENEIAFIFDRRPHRHEEAARIHSIFDRFALEQTSPPYLEPIAFLSSKRSPPLQAADLVAWEYFQLAKVLSGYSNDPQRVQPRKLEESGRFWGQLATERAIQQIVSQPIDPGKLAQIAGHFRTGPTS